MATSRGLIDQRTASAIFSEMQRFTNPLVLVALPPITGLVWWLAADHLFSGRIGRDLGTDIIIAVVWVICGLGLPVLFLALNLMTEVRGDGIYIRFVPFHRRWIRYAWEELDEVEGRTYRPILEYGGWGIRLGPSGVAYNVKGDKGVQLRLRSGRRVLIGTQRLEEFVEAVERARMGYVETAS